MHPAARLFHDLILAALMFPDTAIAEKSAPLKRITTGEYISKGGRGVMNVAVSKKGAITFDIQAGSERGVCDLKGDIKKNKAILSTELGGAACKINFSVKSDGIDVRGDESEACC
jgi:hypothetical protein